MTWKYFLGRFLPVLVQNSEEPVVIGKNVSIVIRDE